MNRTHALLSASGAERWLICTPSARLEDDVDEVESTYADEGTLAHEIAEWTIRQKAYGIDIETKLAKLKQHELFDESMMGYAEDYANYVVGKMREAPAGAILIQEERVNLMNFIPDGFGHVDVMIGSDGTLEIIDYKYGKGVPVDAYENKQMMVYAIGGLRLFDLLFTINKVIMTIYQPRIDNIISYEITSENLMRWAHEILKPTARIAYEGLGELVPGEHCRFCRVRATCTANAKYNLQLAAREFDITTLTDEQIVKILVRADSMKKWITSVEEYALREAMKGRKWPGMKVVKGRSNRQYKDPEKILEELEKAGYKREEIVNKKLPGITELTKKLTTFKFRQLVEPHLFKPPGKPTLTIESDERAEWNSLEAAQNDFKDDEELSE